MKNTKVLKSLALLFVTVMGLTSCGANPTPTPSHTHSYSFKSWDYSPIDEGESFAFANFKCECNKERVLRANVTIADYKDATCSEDGYKKYIASIKPDFSTETFTDTLGHTVQIHSIGHTLGSLVNRVEPTCLKDGHEAYYYCYTCQKYFTAEKVETTYLDLTLTALGHSYGEPTWDFETKIGEHKAIASFECSRCHDVQTAEGLVTEHDVIEPTCEKAGSGRYTASVIFNGKSYDGEYQLSTSPLGHAYGELIPLEAATCTEDGLAAHYQCSRCKKYFDESKVEKTLADLTLNKLGHLKDHHEASDATCAKAGCKEHYYCSRCDKYFSDSDMKNEISKSSVLIPAAHDFDTDNRCKKCGRTDALLYTNLLVKKDKLTLTSETAPDGFAKVYSYSDVVGGGENNNSLFTSNFPLNNFNRIQYAVKCEAGRLYQIHNSLESVSRDLPETSKDTWITVTITKSDSGVWTVSNDFGNFRGTESSSYTISGTPTRMNHVFIPRFEPAENPGFEITEILMDYSATHHIHTFDNQGVCETCGMKVLPYSGTDSYLRDPSLISKTDNAAPFNFQDMYFYNDLCGGGLANCFIKHTLAMPNGMTHLEFAVNVNASTHARMYVATTSGGANTQVAFPDLHWAMKNLSIKVSCDLVSGNTWKITNNYGDFSVGKTITAYPDNYLWTLMRPLIDVPFYITEILYK